MRLLLRRVNDVKLKPALYFCTVYESAGDHQDDKRKRHLEITATGFQLSQGKIQSLLPDVSLILSDWADDDLKQMHGFIEKLMRWLDENRL